MAELLEISFERLNRKSVAILTKVLGLPPSFGSSDSFEQLNVPVLHIGSAEFRDATIGCYPFDGLMDLEISIDHHGVANHLKQAVSEIRSLAEQLQISSWRVGMEPVGDDSTLYFSDQGPGPLWN